MATWCVNEIFKKAVMGKLSSLVSCNWRIESASESAFCKSVVSTTELAVCSELLKFVISVVPTTEFVSMSFHMTGTSPMSCHQNKTHKIFHFSLMMSLQRYDRYQSHVMLLLICWQRYKKISIMSRLFLLFSKNRSKSLFLLHNKASPPWWRVRLWSCYTVRLSQVVAVVQAVAVPVETLGSSRKTISRRRAAGKDLTLLL